MDSSEKSVVAEDNNMCTIVTINHETLKNKNKMKRGVWSYIHSMLVHKIQDLKISINYAPFTFYEAMNLRSSLKGNFCSALR